MSLVFLLRGDPQGMALACHKAIACDRNLAHAHGNLAAATVWLGRPNEGLRHVEQAMRLDPQSPQLAVMLSIKGRAHLLLTEAQAAAECFDQGLMANPNFPGNHAGLAMAQIMLGNHSAARMATDRLLRSVSDFRLSRSGFAPLVLSPPAYRDLYEKIILPAAQQADLPL
jgi:tetratricopeptide (TPR) repeat protein